MAVTLNEVAKVSQTPLGKAVVLDLLRQSRILQLIPVDNVSALKVTDVRWQTLPTVATRNLNEAYTESTGTVEQVEDTLFIYGGDISVDRVLLKVKTLDGQNPLTIQGKMKTAALAARFNDDFINNDHTIDPKGFEGIKKRVTNQPARATIDLATAGDSLKVLASAATQMTFIDAIHTALHRLGVDQGNSLKDANIAFFMNEGTFLGFGMNMRRNGLITVNTDAYDRIFTTFGPAKLIDVGLKADQVTEIITDTEDPGDAGNDSTSIYAVRFGGISHADASGRTTVMDDDGVRLIQLTGTSPDPYDPLQGAEAGAGLAPLVTRRIDWVLGLKQVGRFSVVRIKGFKMAAA